MVGGQYVDMESENKEIAFETLKYIHSHKTGKLLKAALELPMEAIGVGGKQKEALLEYSELIGIAFQIKDDLLDIEGEFEKTGKQSSDEKNNKTTYPKLFGLEKTKEILSDYTEKAKTRIQENFENAERLLELADYIGSTTGIINYAGETDAQEMIICTESGVLYELEKRYPEKKFYFTETLPVCRNMKKVTLEKILHVLK